MCRGFGEPGTAAQLSSLLMLFVLLLFVLERYMRKRIRYHNPSNATRKTTAIALHGKHAILAVIACVIPPLLGFIIPLIQLGIWSIKTFKIMVDDQFWMLAVNSLVLAASAAALTLLLAIILAYGRRENHNPLVRGLINLCAMGYAVPGIVIAVGVLIVLGKVDYWLIGFLAENFGLQTGLLLTGTIFALVFAHTVRFLSLALQTVGASLNKVNKSVDEVSRLLGSSSVQTLRNIHLPIIRSGLLTAALLVFVEVMKELPATLIMRPFNFNTLAVRAYELASDERLADASTAALAIVLTGILPILMLHISIRANANQ